VTQGQKIGTVGDTGSVRKSGRDASHLHFEIYHNGSHVNPLRYLFS
jgi:murein DD-endopeptidase MepM/ murein hydrolase activator NlpD